MKQKTGHLQGGNLVKNKTMILCIFGIFNLLYFALVPVYAGKEKVATASAVDNNAVTDEISIDKLIILLKSTSRDDRLEAIRKFEHLQDEEAKKVLMDYYNKLPAATPSTNAQQTEKVAVLQVLIKKLKPDDARAFLFNALEFEIDAIRKAKKRHSDIYYPRDVWNFIIVQFVKQGINQEMRDALALHANDPSLPRGSRSDLLVPVILFDLDKRGINSLHEKARYVINVMDPRPKDAIPWDIYINREKRIEYGKSTEVKKQNTNWGAWADSDKGVLNSAHERLLEALGLASVEVLVSTFDDDKYASEKKDYFAYLSSNILSNEIRGGIRVGPEIYSLIEKINNYFDMMGDPGQFSWHSYVGRNLNAIYKDLGIPKSVEVRKKGNN
jgi:hypothetical protein